MLPKSGSEGQILLKKLCLKLKYEYYIMIKRKAIT